VLTKYYSPITEPNPCYGRETLRSGETLRNTHIFCQSLRICSMDVWPANSSILHILWQYYLNGLDTYLVLHMDVTCLKLGIMLFLLKRLLTVTWHLISKPLFWHSYQPATI